MRHCVSLILLFVQWCYINVSIYSETKSLDKHHHKYVAEGVKTFQVRRLELVFLVGIKRCPLVINDRISAWMTRSFSASFLVINDIISLLLCFSMWLEIIWSSEFFASAKYRPMMLTKQPDMVIIVIWCTRSLSFCIEFVLRWNKTLLDILTYMFVPSRTRRIFGWSPSACMLNMRWAIGAVCFWMIFPCHMSKPKMTRNKIFHGTL